MKKLLTALSSVTLALTLLSCAGPMGGPGSGPGSYREPTVLMPQGLDQREAGYLGQIAGVMQQNGYRPVDGGYADYQLDFTIETGPINADATLVLRQGPRVVTQATGRDGGPRIIIDRNGVARNAVERCLNEFVPQLRRPEPTPAYGPGYGPNPGYGPGGWQ